MDQLGNAPAPPPSEAAGDITDYIMTHQHKSLQKTELKFLNLNHESSKASKGP